MGELIPFTDAQGAGLARREFQAAAEKVVTPLREVAEMLKWHAWEVIETRSEPDAKAAVDAWQAVAAAVKALETLREIAGEWHGWASSAVPDGPLYEKMLTDAAERFAPQFVKRMKA